MPLKRRDDHQTQFGEAANLGAEQVNSFTWLLVLGDLGVVLIGHTQIVAEDVALLNVESKVVEIIARKDGERIDSEMCEAITGTLEVLESAADSLLGA